ncbi:MAG: hypothetical protein GY797_36875 [Deltaproteobacteria bacterium]|nr:hypothetical protein [Deltaproteobacteria bacterium]
MNIYENSTFSRNYLPNIKCAFCFVLWDFAPVLTEVLCDQILRWLEEARAEIEKLIPIKIALYSVASSTTQIISPEELIDMIGNIQTTIRKIIPDSILQQPDDTFLDEVTIKEVSKIRLAHLHIDREIEAGPMV